MKNVYKIWSDEQIDDTGIYEDDYVQNTLFFVSNKSLAEKIVDEAKKNNLKLESSPITIFENADELLKYLKELSWLDEEYDALKGLDEDD